jgi:hypothetical protein
MPKNPKSADIARLLAHAADLRAGGSSWEHVAATLRRSVATCRGWPHKYPDLWRRAYATAARTRLAEAGAEGLRKVREMLRAEDEKTRHTAAKTLAGLLARTCRSDDGGGERQTDPVLEILEETPDDELCQLLDSVRSLLGERPKAPE